MYVFSSLEKNPKKKRRISGGYVSKGNRHYGRLPALKWIAQSYGERERVSEKEGVKSNGRVMNSRSVPKEFFSFISLPFVPLLIFRLFFPPPPLVAVGEPQSAANS